MSPPGFAAVGRRAVPARRPASGTSGLQGGFFVVGEGQGPDDLRPQTARSLVLGGRRVWLVPGPERACLEASSRVHAGRRRFTPFDSTCRPARLVAGRGVHLPPRCVEGRAVVHGLAPPGVLAVQLLRRGRVVGTAIPRLGLYRVSAATRPDAIIVGAPPPQRLHAPRCA